MKAPIATGLAIAMPPKSASPAGRRADANSFARLLGSETPERKPDGGTKLPPQLVSSGIAEADHLRRGGTHDAATGLHDRTAHPDSPGKDDEATSDPGGEDRLVYAEAAVAVGWPGELRPPIPAEQPRRGDAALPGLAPPSRAAPPEDGQTASSNAADSGAAEPERRPAILDAAPRRSEAREQRTGINARPARNAGWPAHPTGSAMASDRAGVVVPGADRPSNANSSPLKNAQPSSTGSPIRPVAINRDAVAAADIGSDLTPPPSLSHDEPLRFGAAQTRESADALLDAEERVPVAKAEGRGEQPPLSSVDARAGSTADRTDPALTAAAREPEERSPEPVASASQADGELRTSATAPGTSPVAAPRPDRTPAPKPDIASGIPVGRPSVPAARVGSPVPERKSPASGAVPNPKDFASVRMIEKADGRDAGTALDANRDAPETKAESTSIRPSDPRLAPVESKAHQPPTLTTEITIAAARYRHASAIPEADAGAPHLRTLRVLAASTGQTGHELPGVEALGLPSPANRPTPNDADMIVAAPERPRASNAFGTASTNDLEPVRVAGASSTMEQDAASARDPALSALTAAPSPASPAVTIATRLALDDTLRTQIVASSTQLATDRIQASPQTLRIQLAPGHLGVVDATLKMSGAQLEIEIRVENREAYERLRDDEHVIEKALRGRGFETVQVTVVQASVATPGSVRPDTPSLPNAAPAMRDSSADPGSSSGGQRPHGQQEERHGADRHLAPVPPTHRDGSGSGGGLYI